jgi:c-di-GMP-binding flagellar brake protein YcgR
MGEKRQFERVPGKMKVIVHHGDDQTHFAFDALDISAGGIFLKTSEPLDIDTMLKLELLLDDGNAKIMIQGKVVRNTPEGMGVEFSGLDSIEQYKLKEFIIHMIKELIGV